MAWREVVDEYADAVDDLLRRSETGLPPRHVVNRAAKAQKALAHVADRLDELGRQSGVIISGQIPGVVAQSVHWSQVLAKSQLPKGPWSGLGLSWTEPNTRAIDAIVKRTTQQVESALRPLSRGAEREMKRALIRGIAAGQNPRVAARRMIKNSKGIFDGGLPRAQNIARTEMIDAYRRSADQSREAAKDVIKGWVWWATLDVRTCGSCLAQAGTEHPRSESGPHDHQQGRCIAIPITKSWAELGIDAPEPKSITQNGKEWFEKQSEADQRKIVGPARLKALQDGKIDFSDLSVRRTNVGWRDSYGMPSVDSL